VRPPAPYPPAVGVSGKSGSGKTLLIERLVPRLIARGARVTVVKHCSHHIEADTPGKDSDRIFRAGADVLAAGPDEAFARFHEGEMPLDEALRRTRLRRGSDVCIVEGYRGGDVPRIVVTRGPDREPEAPAGEVLAIVTDPLAEVDRVEPIVWQVMEEAHRALPVMGLLVVGRETRDARGAIRELDTPTQEVLLAGAAPAPAGASGLRRLPDAPGVEGLLARLLSAMRWMPAARWVVLDSRARLTDTRAVEWVLSELRVGVDAVIPAARAGASGDSPLAVYGPACLAHLERAVLEGASSPDDALVGARVLRPSVPAPR
jgi:molybdopterin-guanine dinucleotide biosynthesis protein MobB